MSSQSELEGYLQKKIIQERASARAEARAACFSQRNMPTYEACMRGVIVQSHHTSVANALEEVFDHLPDDPDALTDADMDRQDFESRVP